MAVGAGEVMPGGYFMTVDREELRRIYRVAADAQGYPRAWYQCKPVAGPVQPPTLEPFPAQRAYRLSEPEVQALRDSGVLLKYE